MSRKTLDREQIQQLAFEHGLKVYFEYRVAQNTGREIEVGYVYRGSKELFCKRNPDMEPGTFYLCNEFEGWFQSFVKGMLES